MTGLITWRDRPSGPAWHTVTAGLLLALLIAWSGHDTGQIGVAVVLMIVMLAQAITGHAQPPHAAPVPPAPDGQAGICSAFIQSVIRDGAPHRPTGHSWRKGSATVG